MSNGDMQKFERWCDTSGKRPKQTKTADISEYLLGRLREYRCVRYGTVDIAPSNPLEKEYWTAVRPHPRLCAPSPSKAFPQPGSRLAQPQAYAPQHEHDLRSSPSCREDALETVGPSLPQHWQIMDTPRKRPPAFHSAQR
ncbi:hypothetical protein VTO73DRAFT_10160 [Trametes versicolor]